MTSLKESSSRLLCRSAAIFIRGEMRTVRIVSVVGIVDGGDV